MALSVCSVPRPRPVWRRRLGPSRAPAGLLSVLCARLSDPRVGDSRGARPSVPGFSHAASVSQAHPWGGVSAASCSTVRGNHLLSLSLSRVDGPVGGFHFSGAGPRAALSVCVQRMGSEPHGRPWGLAVGSGTALGPTRGLPVRVPGPLAELPRPTPFCRHGSRLCLPSCCPGTGAGRVGGCPLSPLGKGRSGDWEEGPDESPLRRSVPQCLKVGSSVAAVSSSRCCPRSRQRESHAEALLRDTRDERRGARPP